MSTIVQCAANEDAGARMSIEVGALDGYTQAPRVYLRIRDGGKVLGLVNPTRADFLSAVEAECGVRIVPADAIVIERAELPEVTEAGTSQGIHGPIARVRADGRDGYADTPSADYRRAALASLALAEYLDAHPPVPPVSDEDVETLADLLTGVAPLIAATDTLARRLLATGRVSVTHE